MSEEQGKDNIKIISQIKKLLYNFDMALVYADGEIVYRQANMKLYKYSKKRYEKALFVSNKVDKEKFEIYKKELQDAKDEIMKSINGVLDKYNPKYKQIFIMRFFEERTVQEIADTCGYSSRAVDYIIAKLRADFIDVSL